MKGSPYAIAMGAALGLFLNFIPSFGIGFLIAAAIAKLFKASALAALTMNLGTGFFIPLFYSLNFLTGRFLMGSETASEEMGGTIQQPLHESLELVEGVAGKSVIDSYLDSLQSFSVDFFLGGVVNAFLASGLIYFIFWGLLTYRRHRRENHNKLASETNTK